MHMYILTYRHIHTYIHTYIRTDIRTYIHVPVLATLLELAEFPAGRSNRSFPSRPGSLPEGLNVPQQGLQSMVHVPSRHYYGFWYIAEILRFIRSLIEAGLKS